MPFIPPTLPQPFLNFPLLKSPNHRPQPLYGSPLPWSSSIAPFFSSLAAARRNALLHLRSTFVYLHLHASTTIFFSVRLYSHRSLFSSTVCNPYTTVRGSPSSLCILRRPPLFVFDLSSSALFAPLSTTPTPHLRTTYTSVDHHRCLRRRPKPSQSA